MKRVVLVLVGLLCLAPVYAQQPEDGVARHSLKTNLLSSILIPSGSFSFDINYEYNIAPRWAAAMDLGSAFKGSESQAVTTRAIFLQPQCRFYFNDQRRAGVMPFVGLGINLAQIWERFECYTGNDGWDIHTESYKVSEHAIRPSIVFGLKQNIPFGLTIEETVGMLITDYYRLPKTVFYNLLPNFITTQFAIRIGWAF